MTNKKLDVLNYLQKNPNWKTASEISTALGYSVRSIKSYIHELNSTKPDMILSSQKGFLLNNYEHANELMKELNTELPQTKEERISYIIKKLVVEDTPYDLDRFADDLFVSPLTLQNELAALKSELANYDLVLKTKSNIAHIIGNERNKKRLISSMIYRETKAFNCTLPSIQPYFPEFDLKILKHIISNALISNSLFMDDFLLFNFIIHVAISMQRSSHDEYLHIENTGSGSLVFPDNIKEAIHSVANEIMQYFDIQLSDEDKNELAALLMSQTYPREILDTQASGFECMITEEVNALFELIQNKIRHLFSINLNSEKFSLRFKLHLSNMLFRIRNNICLRNPQIGMIKTSYAFVYEIAVSIADVINQQYHFKLNEDEIAYIVLHIGVLIEEQKAFSNKVSVLIVNTQYGFFQMNLAEKIKLLLEQDAIITGIASSVDELTFYKDYDVIISTIPIYPLPSVPVIYISEQFSTTDISNVIENINRIKALRMKLIVEQKLRYLFNEDLFFFNQPFHSETDAISFLSDQLEQQGIVPADFKQRLLERESISPSAYGNIAIPHPLERCAKSSAIAVSIHPTPINWGQNNVNIIFMLAIHPSDQILFNDIFAFVTQIIANNHYLQTLITANSCQEFIKLLLSYLF